jgi:hypothetical protein
MMRAAPGAAILRRMATLVAIGYPDEATAEAARATVANLEEDTKKLQEALTPTDQVGAAS